MRATICLPRNVDIGESASLCEALMESLRHDSDDHRLMLLLIHLDRPGVLWRGLFPRLMGGSKETAKTTLYCLFNTFLKEGNRSHALTTAPKRRQQFSEKQGETNNCDLRQCFLQRRVRVRLQKNYSSICKRQTVLLFIRPPSRSAFQSMFNLALNHLEHELIMYQTMAAWYSTLGGGFFFCRHLSTALILAKKQQRIAIRMGDYTMAYKCLVNQAYNYIYAGQFDNGMAIVRSLLRQYHYQQNPKKYSNNWSSNIASHHIDHVVVDMCISAKLFCKRFRKACKHLGQKGDTGKLRRQRSLTVDDYQRIRIVQDQSSTPT